MTEEARLREMTQQALAACRARAALERLHAENERLEMENAVLRDSLDRCRNDRVVRF